MFELAKQIFIIAVAHVLGYFLGGGAKTSERMTYADSVQLHYDTTWWNKADHAYYEIDRKHERGCTGVHMACSVNHPLSEECRSCMVSTLMLDGL